MGRAPTDVMKILMVLNEAPYGSERTYNGLRLAGSLVRQEGVELKVFLMGDAVVGSRRGQKVPSGYYNVQNMLVVVLRHHAAVGVCGSCMDARGITDADLVEGARRSSMEELTAWTLEAEKTLVF
jgi:uncharacterized protein involved in oxidation of intracellular sulfur